MLWCPDQLQHVERSWIRKVNEPSYRATESSKRLPCDATDLQVRLMKVTLTKSSMNGGTCVSHTHTEQCHHVQNNNVRKLRTNGTAEAMLMVRGISTSLFISPVNLSDASLIRVSHNVITGNESDERWLLGWIQFLTGTWRWCHVSSCTADANKWKPVLCIFKLWIEAPRCITANWCLRCASGLLQLIIPLQSTKS
jgi:hypothetical protein